MKTPRLSPDRKTGMICWPSDPWQHPYACDAMGPDGKVRRVRLNQDASTFFSWDGRVNHGGKTVRCFVTCDDGIHTYTILEKEAR